MSTICINPHCDKTECLYDDYSKWLNDFSDKMESEFLDEIDSNINAGFFSQEASYRHSVMNCYIRELLIKSSATNQSDLYNFEYVSETEYPEFCRIEYSRPKVHIGQCKICYDSGILVHCPKCTMQACKSCTETWGKRDQVYGQLRHRHKLECPQCRRNVRYA